LRPIKVSREGALTVSAKAGIWQRAIEKATAEYEQGHPRSRDVIRRMAAWLPGGDTRSTTWFDPYPIVMETAKGAEMTDVDGNVLFDFLANYTLLVHGHCPPFVDEAIRSTLGRGFLFGSPMREQGALAEHLLSRLSSAERVRFTNSGTEATMLAARIARRYTGRRRLAVARFSYHGSFEDLVWDAAESTGSAVFPADDADGAEAILRAAGPLAAIFIEPVLGSGGIFAVPGEVLERLRRVADETGALLVFDEVMTFRLGYGGAQEGGGVTPDITCLGKIIGGGMPVGAVAGRADVLAVTDPHTPGHMEHGGTFNGHRLAMVAGLASLQTLDRAAIERINALGDRLACGVRAVIAGHNVPVSITNVGSLLNFHAAPDVRTPAQAEEAAAAPLRRFLHLALVNRGIFLPTRCEMCISTAMTDETVDRAVAAVDEALAEAEHLRA
jgi:glutamate-1-semialdehyde 2,1-aminomutase